MRISKARGTEKGCETCHRPFEPGELVGYAGRGKTYHRGECAETAGPAAWPGRPSRKGGWGTLGTTYGTPAFA